MMFCSFSDSVMMFCSFADSVMMFCSFSDSVLMFCSFADSVMMFCSFADCVMMFCSFSDSVLMFCSFADSLMLFCSFADCVMMFYSLMKNCLFADSVVMFCLFADSLMMDWSQPVGPAEDELVLKWDDDEEEDSDPDTGALQMKTIKSSEEEAAVETTGAEIGDGGHLDIMAQQLKFVACLKILMEELSTLATGFEVDGGQLRYQLYVWLEREVDALRQLCNYSAGDADAIGAAEEGAIDGDPSSRDTPTALIRPGDKPTLHEILMAEKMDFEAKVQRAAKRKKWLKANETLLRTLLSYCSLHGASGGGLASVRMELVLLLQELQQEKTQQQLLSPLPFPTTLPLLSASVACNKTVVADPVRHLQSQTHDMLQTIVELRSPPMPSRAHFSEVFVLRDLAIALSACIYQSLCDSDTFSIKQQGDNFQSSGLESLARMNVMYPSSHLIQGQTRRRRYSSDEPLQVTTHPAKWPGVTNLRALLAREKDEDTPRLNVLLCEAFVATYMSLMVYALTTCDSLILYRLAGQKFNNQTWAMLFGGGVKKLLKVAAASSSSNQVTPSVVSDLWPGVVVSSLSRRVWTGRRVFSSEGGVWTTVTSLTKQRVRLNMKLLGQFGSQPGTPHMKEDKPTYREQFVPPEMSMVSYFLIKRKEASLGQRSSRFSLLYTAARVLLVLQPQLPLEDEEVDYDSADSAVSDLDSEEDEDVFDGSAINPVCVGRSKENNTEHCDPNSYSWCVLRLALMKVVQGQLQDFLQVAGIELQELPVCSPLVHGTLRVVTQWQEMLKEELDARRPPPADYIPGCFVETAATGPAIHKYRSLLDKHNTPFHPKHASAAPVRRLWNYLVCQESLQEIFIRAVFGKRRSVTSGADTLVDNVKVTSAEDKVSSEPSVALPEPVRIIHKEQDSITAFCLNQVNHGLLALCTPREVQEMDISLLLELPSWLEDECEIDLINLYKEPETLPESSFWVIQTAADRPMLAQTQSPNIQNYSTPSSPQPSSGLGGQTGRGASVMKGLNFPGSHDPRFCQFVIDRSRHLLKPVSYHYHASYLLAHVAASFSCHDQGASSVVYAPQHQLLISAGKKGDVCLLDVRQRQVRHRFVAHESPVKCLAIDPAEEFFVTGAADGDIKVWALSGHNALHSFSGEHARSSFFKNIGQGVTQLHVDGGSRLFSCGADGSMKVRQLPDRDLAVHTIY
uniref:DmX-like protein 2 n=1 Tax=Timema douglasi TaxID=61478 RepID=A0A7R8ZC30_TIMDO|nr:unnamed protein product [Timema douglasi]